MPNIGSDGEDNIRLALHTCCGPCLIEPLRLLSRQFADIVSVYYNPNIAPPEEYLRRRDTFVAYARSQGLRYVELEYGPSLWADATRDTPLPPLRCEQCYRIRFERATAWAAQNGCTHFATTLTVSPYQNQSCIERVAREFCTRHDLVYAGYDFSPYYQNSVLISRQMGMYRQKYCGCAPSECEASQQRARRKK